MSSKPPEAGTNVQKAEGESSTTAILTPYLLIHTRFNSAHATSFGDITQMEICMTWSQSGSLYIIIPSGLY